MRQKPTLEKHEQNFPYLFCGFLNIHHLEPPGHSAASDLSTPNPPVCNQRLILEHRERCPTFARLQLEKLCARILDVPLRAARNGFLHGSYGRMICAADES
jgi:hypothetical protein